MYRFAFAAVGSLLLGLSVRAQADSQQFSAGVPETTPGDKLPLVRLKVHAAALPSPALKYMLLPELRDVLPGNAALLYQRSHSPEWWNAVYRSPDFAKVTELLNMPLSKIPPERLDKLTLLPGSALKELDRAARYEYCDWDMLRRVREDGIGTLLPDVQGFRTAAQLLALRSRKQMLAGDLDKALYTFQTMLQLSRHLNESPILISMLVSSAIANTTLNQVEDFVQREKAPNLYWALADLPQPFLDLRKPLQGEKVMIDALMPGVRDLIRDPKAPPLTTAVVEQSVGLLSALELSHVDKHKFMIAWTAARIYPAARRYFLAQGRTAEQLDALPVTVVGLMYTLVKYDEFFDDMYKWHSTPYWEARPGLQKAEAKFLKAKREEPESTLLATLLAPAVQRVHFTRAQLQRRVAALQIVEALRWYASEHDGNLPARLEDIKEPRLPLDPVTGKAFEYTLAKGRALLYAPPPAGEAPSQLNTVRYEINIAAAEK